MFEIFGSLNMNVCLLMVGQTAKGLAKFYSLCCNREPFYLEKSMQACFDYVQAQSSDLIFGIFQFEQEKYSAV